MPKETKKAISFEEAEILRKEVAKFKVENAAFAALIRSTHDHYGGLILQLEELLNSVKTAQQDSAKLIDILDKRTAAQQEAAEEGIQKGGTG